MCDKRASLLTKVLGEYAGYLFGNKTARGLSSARGRGEKEQLERTRGGQDPSTLWDGFALPIPAQRLGQATAVLAHDQVPSAG